MPSTLPPRASPRPPAPHSHSTPSTPGNRHSAQRSWADQVNTAAGRSHCCPRTGPQVDVSEGHASQVSAEATLRSAVPGTRTDGPMRWVCPQRRPHVWFAPQRRTCRSSGGSRPARPAEGVQGGRPTKSLGHGQRPCQPAWECRAQSGHTGARAVAFWTLTKGHWARRLSRRGVTQSESTLPAAARGGRRRPQTRFAIEQRRGLLRAMAVRPPRAALLPAAAVTLTLLPAPRLAQASGCGTRTVPAAVSGEPGRGRRDVLAGAGGRTLRVVRGSAAGRCLCGSWRRRQVSQPVCTASEPAASRETTNPVCGQSSNLSFPAKNRSVAHLCLPLWPCSSLRSKAFGRGAVNSILSVLGPKTRHPVSQGAGHAVCGQLPAQVQAPLQPAVNECSALATPQSIPDQPEGS